ncbi:hypothetical protein V865_000597 [Kwoniella europaea PYCC6329]|uniref:Uncharacterized protein n=1 Tax=Kwoniella europaea PYCC6329 TaxID=1423913 RepID=A0AAX4KA04_9TREE
MGLLSRFKHSSPSPSTATASSSKQPQPRNESTSASTPRPTTPTSTTHLSANLHDTPSSSRLARPTIPPPSPSSNSITSKLTKPFKKDKSKGREKVKENLVTGVPYESHSQASLPIPPHPGSVSGSRIVSAPNSPSNTERRPPNGRQRRSTLLSFDPPLPPQPSSPLATTDPLSAHTRYQDPGPEEHIFDDDHNHDQVDSPSARRKDRVTSGQFRQVGGILGQLNFEVDHDHDQPGNPPPEKWLRTNANAPNINPTPTVMASNSRSEINGDSEIDGGVRGMTPSITDESIVIVNKDEINQENNTSLDISLTDQDHNEENKMELLESAEKKNKFWKRQRRSSKSNADGSEIERTNSPTPRRNSRNDTSLDLTANRPSLDSSRPEPRQPRPQQLRRPSSSFFHNPFTRSVSRTSLALDENPKPDDGSFQLRGFRHVSGMMEVEGAGELENYLAHVRKEPRSSISSGDLLTSPTVGNQDIPSPSALTGTSPPVSYASTPRQPPTFPLSRPASIANSLGSATGDEFISATKVSVAAFRKGIRRPSENLATMSDSGHGSTTALRNISGQHPPLHPADGNVGGIDGDLDDEDDVPLGMIRGKDMMRREKSSLSLSSMRHTGTPSVSEPNERRPSTMFDQSERKPSPSPAVLNGQLSPEVIDRQNTPSPNPSMIERSFTPSPNVSSSDVTRRGSPALGRPQDIPRKPSPNPALSFTVHRQRQGHTRNGGGSGGGGFVVKSTRLTRDDFLPMNGAQTPDDKPGSHIPSTSSPSTPDLQQTDQSKSVSAEGGDFVSLPEKIEPIDGYFSHLAPLIHDQPAPSTTSKRDISLSPPPSSRETPSPTRAPGPPVAPLPLPQADDPSAASLKLPLPPDQMPDTPPKQPAELPLSPSNRKKLSLLEEPMKIISGLWSSPTTDDGFDPAFVLSSMDAYGGDEQKVDESTKSPQPTLAKVQTTAPISDVEEKVRSPLSQRLAGIASSASTSNLSKPSLSHIKTSEGDREDGYSTENMKSPMSDSTISPITTTTTGVRKETFQSSFARARKPSHKFEDTEESDEESEDESGTVESSSTTPQSKSKIKTKPQSSSNGRKRNNVERRVPHGPRKPSINNRNRKRVSSMFDTNPSAIQARTTSRNEEDDEPLGQGRRVIGKSPSVSNIGVAGVPRSESALGISTISTRRDNPPVGQRPKTLMELGPIVQPLKDRSFNHPTSPLTSTRPKPTPSSSSYGRPPLSQDNEKKRSTTTTSTTVPTMKRSPAQTLIKLPPEVEEKRKTSTASPDSSWSATTGGSVNHQPLTPKESENRRLVRDQMPSKANKQLTYQEPKADSVTTNHTRQRSYSSMGRNQPQPQSQAGQWNMNMGYDHNQMAMMGQMPQMGIGMGMQGMDPEAIRNMMKQQWQMQFMAAAFRASEEEWERASCVSGQTSHTLPASFGQASGGYAAQQPYVSMPQMGWGGMMGQFPMGGYGHPQGQGMFPHPNQLYGYNMPPQSPGPGSGGSPSQGGMYSYGTGGGGAQSVFGGEFGPPPITPSQRFMSSTQPQPPLPSNSQQEIARNTRGRYNSSTQSHSQSVYIPSNLSSGVNASPPPPSSWGRRMGSGDWSDLPQGQGQGQGKKIRPQTQFIN